jgi:hypothetical protein
MLPLLSVLLTFVASLFRSPAALRLENLAVRHQLAVYQQTIRRPRLRPSDRLFWAWLSSDRLFWAWLSRLWVPKTCRNRQPADRRSCHHAARRSS